MKFKLNLLTIDCVCLIFVQSVIGYIPEPDEYLSIPDLIEHHGYPHEVHHVETEDGFILGLVRIPHGRNESSVNATNKTTVFLQHGLFVDASIFLIGHSQPLAFQLADKGYDVWLGNYRATPMSQKHLKYTPMEREYWAWSWDELGAYDLASSLQYVADVTQQKGKILYIGHSMGTTTLFVLLSTKPKFNDYIKTGFVLAPVVYTSHVKGLTGILFQIFGRFPLDTHFGKFNILPRAVQFVIAHLCQNTEVLCRTALNLLFGPDPVEMDETMIPVSLSRFPNPTSVRTVLQYGQQGVSNQFQHFNYGFFSNLKKYGSIHPLKYSLKQTTIPIYIYYGPGDYVANQQDVRRLASELPNVKVIYRVPHEFFNHDDFFWAKHVNKLLYDKLIADMENALLT